MTAADTASTLVTAAKAAAERISARAREEDRARALSQDTLHDLHQAGLLTMSMPRDEGGTEADLMTQARVFEELARASGSAAWCLGNHSGTAIYLRAVLGPDTEPFLRSARDDGYLLAHARGPAAQLEAASGGFRISGRWAFASGSHSARWIVLIAPIAGPPPGWQNADGETPPPMHMRAFVVDLQDPAVEIVDTWRAMSLRASMSNDVSLHDYFVPDAATALDALPLFPTGVWSRPDDPPVLRVPLVALFSFVASLSLGVAGAALDDTVAYAKSAPMAIGGRPEGSVKGSMPGTQFALADAAMTLASARAFFFQEVGSIADTVAHGDSVGPESANRMAMADLTARLHARRAVDQLFDVRGAHGLYEDHDFERYYRDVRVSTLHAFLAPDMLREQIGKFLLGIPPDADPRWG